MQRLLFCQLTLQLLVGFLFVPSLLVPVDGFTSRKSTVRNGAVSPSFYHGTPSEYSPNQFHGFVDTIPSARSRVEDSIIIASHADWLELIHGDNNNGDEDERLSMVLFKAKFCKSCQRLERDWKQKVLPLVGPSLQVATVEFTTNKALFKQLMVKDLPTIHFYKHGNLLSEFTCPPKDFHQVIATLHYYLDESQQEQHYQERQQQQKQP